MKLKKLTIKEAISIVEAGKTQPHLLVYYSDTDEWHLWKDYEWDIDSFSGLEDTYTKLYKIPFSQEMFG